ncbi:unnamed protein product [Moneuplotes crassus]|uniref:Uncharacterized protein n=1 Tax=Euplotes crassus TaxID=5936 RepID=A0AAD1XHD6_EUPCR|nr:unnamed protein product [Moneuplotes crassus]
MILLNSLSLMVKLLNEIFCCTFGTILINSAKYPLIGFKINPCSITRCSTDRGKLVVTKLAVVLFLGGKRWRVNWFNSGIAVYFIFFINLFSLGIIRFIIKDAGLLGNLKKC